MQTTILILEDEFHTAANISNILQTSGYRTIVTRNSASAIKTIEKNKIDLALLDIKLVSDKHDGIYVAKKLKEKYNKEIPIIYLTAYTEESPEGVKAKSISPNFLDKNSFNLKKDLPRKIDEEINKFRVEEGEDETDILFTEKHQLIINTLVNYKKSKKDGGGYNFGEKKRRVLLSIDGIMYVEAHYKKIRIHSDIGSFVVTLNMKEFMKLIETFPDFVSKKLFRAHKSSVVNCDRIIAYDRVGNQNYVYFEVDQLEGRGVPVTPSFIRMLESKHLKANK